MKEYITRKVVEIDYESWRKTDQYNLRISYVICKQNKNPLVYISFESSFESEGEATFESISRIFENRRREMMKQIITWIDAGLNYDEIKILADNKLSGKFDKTILYVADIGDYNNPENSVDSSFRIKLHD